MAQSGYTPIQLYYSTVSGNTPLAVDLTNGELALNTSDGILYYKDSAGAVEVLASGSSVAVSAALVATTVNLASLSGLLTVDGVTVTAGQRVLVKDQTLSQNNGLYVAAVGAWTRAIDANSAAEIASRIITVRSGSTNGGEQWATTFKSTDTLGTTAMPWYQVALQNTSVAFSALNVTGNTTLGDASADTVTVNGTVASNLIFTDNTYDIGASGATRPRTGYFGTSVFAPLVDATNLEVTNIKALDGTASIAIASSTGIATFSKATIVETTDNTNAALRVTQLGTGNALLVEDSTNPDTTPFVIDATGATVIGATTALALTISGTPQLSQGGITTAPATNAFSRWDASATGFDMQFGKSRSGTVGTYGIVSSGDSAGQLQFFGDDGTAFVSLATISANVDGTPSVGDMPGRLVFSTTADGASVVTERMRITSTGAVAFNGASNYGTSGQVLTSSGNSAPTWTTPTVGTVTSVAALTLGTTGTDLSSTVANGTTTPVITLNVPTASATNRGALSAADWTTFNNKGSGTVTSVTGTSPVDSSGGTTPAISLAASYGDTQNPYASKTANYVLAAPNGSAGVPTFRAIVAADIPTLNQNTTGSAGSLSATLAIASGGSGQTTAQLAMNAFAGAVTSGSYLRGDGTNVVMNTIQVADVPTLNQSTTGSAATLTTARTISITGDLAYTSGSFNGSADVTGAGTLATVNSNVGSFTNASITVNGKGLITAASSGSSLVSSVTATSPVASSGGTTPDISLSAGYGDTLNPYASKTAKFFLAAPNASAGVPVFRAIVASDVPTLDQNTTGSAGSLSATLVATQGGTGQSSYAVGDLLYASTTTALSKLADVATGNALISGGVGAAPTYGKIGLTTHISGTLAVGNGGTGATSLALASIATYSGTETLTNKRIDPRVVSAASASSLTPSVATADIYAYTALAANLTINAPTGTPVDGDKLIFRLLDNGTARTLTWDATYTVIGVSLPAATTANKMVYVGCIYNAANTRWDVIAITTQA
jgi:hypothetical protein